MNNNTTFFEAFLALVIILTLLGVVLIGVNPKIESDCAAKGGQILARPGHLSSCLYSAK